MVVSESVNLDRVFEILSDGQRRRLLYHLSESSESTATVDELIDLLGGNPDRAAIRLRHVHLPHLVSTRAIDYDERTDTVRYRGTPFLEGMLDCCREEYGSHSR